MKVVVIGSGGREHAICYSLSNSRKVSKIYWQKSKLFDGMQNPFNATRYHSLIVDNKKINNQLKITAKTDENIIMAIEHKTLPFFGVQFHPESIATEDGHKLLKNFLKIREFQN